jgi:hypothetical protein
MPEKKGEQQDQADKFTWKEGDLVYVGHQELTEEQKELVKKMKGEEEK